ncbi:MAG: hypothetical protein IPJ19_14905 [Planctomycetes bacterium]|nr:hypothetical protein [Planctomycetota bacterium]
MKFAPIALLVCSVPAFAGTANFDANAEGILGVVYTESGITFSNLDNTLQPIGTASFICEQADGTLAGQPGFSSPNCVGATGWSPGPGASFGRTKSYEMSTGASASHASLELYLFGSYAGNTVTLEAYQGASVVASNGITIPGGFSIQHYTLSVSGVSFDHLRLVGGGPSDSGVFFGLVDGVTIDSSSFDSGCEGDGSLAACPCANSGLPGRGCNNSAATGGAELDASGSVSPDTVVLHASGELPNASSVFLQGTATISPVPFGDGLRCVGGVLKRLVVKPASGGSVSYPVGAELSITQRSAQLGDPLTAGSLRHYQTYYRDPSSSFCPSGGTYNVTNSVSVHW